MDYVALTLAISVRAGGALIECGIRRHIDAQSSTRSIDREIAAVAARQHGTVARWQLLEAGITRQQIARRLRARRLTELHRGVYLVGAVAPRFANDMAALLAVKLQGTLSHFSAAALWKLRPYPASAPVWLTMSRDVVRRRIKVSRALLDPSDIRRRENMALTSPPRTILDLAAVVDADELERIVAEVNFRGNADDRELRSQLERNPGKRGARRLRHVLDLPGGPKRTRSSGERALLRLLRDHGIEGFDTNVLVAGYEVDFLFAEANLAIEVDGWDAHSGRVAFERDRLKVAALRAQGISVMPVTGRQIRNDADGVVARLLAAINPSSRR